MILTHIWKISNVSMFAKNETNYKNKSTILHSNSFPQNNTCLQFSLRMITHYKKENLALFLHLDKFVCTNKNWEPNEKQSVIVLAKNKNDIKVNFEILLKSCNNDEICKKECQNIFSQDVCYGFENFLTMKEFYILLQNKLKNDTLVIVCNIYLDNTFSLIIQEIFSITETTDKFYSTQFSTEISIKNFSEKFFKNKNPVIKSDWFSPPNNDKIKFYIVLLKNESFKNKESFISIYLAFKSEQYTVEDIFWRVSILNWCKKPFVTAEGSGKFNLENQVMGVPEFIQEKKLFNFENGLLKYKNLELFVEVSAGIVKKLTFIEETDCKNIEKM